MKEFDEKNEKVQKDEKAVGRMICRLAGAIFFGSDNLRVLEPSKSAKSELSPREHLTATLLISVK